MTIQQHQALAELTLLSQSDNHHVAEIADVVMAVYHQYQDRAVDQSDYQSIISRNLSQLKELTVSPEQTMAIRALEDLV